MKRFKFILFFLLCGTIISTSQTPAFQKQRLIVLTDIENEPDDTQSLVRLLLYSNQIDIRGLIACNSTHMRNRVAPESILNVIDEYAKVQDNLLKHEKGFPVADDLRSIVKSGPTAYGMSAVGDGLESEGSEWIINELRKDDERPVWISAWGGTNTLAQALYKLKKNSSAKQLKQLIAKLRIYAISDQDDTGIWIRKNFPELFYIVSPGGYGNASWLGIMDSSYPIDNSDISNEWLAKNIQQGHGPLGSCYPDVAYGMEGDTPSWLNLIPNGLNNPEHPDWGGWGGRYEYYRPQYESLDLNGFNGNVPIEDEPHAIWTNASDTYYPYQSNSYGRGVKRSDNSCSGNRVTIVRWRSDFQNDFAARMDWCTKSWLEANHAPIPKLAHSEHFSVKSGATFTLDASGSSDPDGDSLSYLWFNYPEAGSWKSPVNIQNAENIYRVNVVAPVVNKKETIHFILKVTDKGEPALSRYKRVIVTVLSK